MTARLRKDHLRERSVEGRQQLDDAPQVPRHLSPGESADLLAVTWFLARFPADDSGQPRTWPPLAA